MQFKLIDRGSTVKTGDLAEIVTEHGHTIYESKHYFNHPPGFENPSVIFTTPLSRDRIILDLKLTGTGFSSGTVRNCIKFGCNLNRIKNRPGRYGLTVWCESLRQAAAAV